MRLRGTLAVGRERRSDGLGKHARDERMTWRWIQNRIRNRAASGAPSGLAGGAWRGGSRYDALGGDASLRARGGFVRGGGDILRVHFSVLVDVERLGTLRTG